MQAMQPTLFAETVRLGIRIAMIWAGGFVFAVLARVLLPDEYGIPFMGRHSTQIIPFSRAGFWTCLLAALTVTAMIVVHAMLVDLGLRAPR